MLVQYNLLWYPIGLRANLWQNNKWSQNLRTSTTICACAFNIQIRASAPHPVRVLAPHPHLMTCIDHWHLSEAAMKVVSFVCALISMMPVWLTIGLGLCFLVPTSLEGKQSLTIDYNFFSIIVSAYK